MLLTKGDDFPIHQTADPIAYSGTDRNFYDRYYFNGYSHDGSVYFACALGVYPHLNIMDGAFCVCVDGVQHNLRVSRHLQMERLDIQVGPLRIDVIEPLQRLRLRVVDNEYGITADITFSGRAEPVKEPRFTRHIGPRTYMDYTRLTQNGVYEGWIDVRGRRIELRPEAIWGTRDRSWGVRPIGLPDPQEYVPSAPQQFFWVWAPLNFDDGFTLYHLNADEAGVAWNQAAVMVGCGHDEPHHTAVCGIDIALAAGSRHARSASIVMTDRDGPTHIELFPQWKFYMSGLGYLHPEWGHGFNKGPLAIGYDSITTASVQSHALPYHLHIQAFVTARMTRADGTVRHGSGVLEQLFIGPYAPLHLS